MGEGVKLSAMACLAEDSLRLGVRSCGAVGRWDGGTRDAVAGPRRDDTGDVAGEGRGKGGSGADLH